jgi:hypothetical protein
MCVIAAATTVMVASGCGGGGSGCGTGVKLPPGKDGGSFGGTLYTDVKGSPVVSFGGDGTSCNQLQALADAYDTETGVKLFSWLSAHHWTWMNYDDQAKHFMAFDGSTNDVFIGSKKGQKSQVAFPT